MKDKSELNTIVCNKYFLDESFDKTKINELQKELDCTPITDDQFIILQNPDIKVRINKQRMNEMIVESKGRKYQKHLFDLHKKISIVGNHE